MEYLLRTDLWPSIETVVRAPDVDLHVPALCAVEVAAALRRGLLRRTLSEARASEALRDYHDLPLTHHGHRSLTERVVALRRNFSAYDATYVALAERLGGALLTADGPLARAVRTHSRLAVLPS